MVWKNLLFISVKDLFARKGRLLLTMVGITVGVACLFFLLSLTAAIKRKVLSEVLGTIPETELDVMLKEIDVGPIRLAASPLVLNDEMIEKIKTSLPGIRDIYTVESLGIPARMDVTFKVLGTEYAFYTDCGVTGMPAELIAGGLERREDEEKLLREFVFRREQIPVPIVVSSHLVEMYNLDFAPAMNMPKLSPGWIKKWNYELTLGESATMTLKGDMKVLDPLPCKVVGVSRRAPVTSVTVPPAYIGYWKKRYFDEEKKRTYQKVVIFAESVNLVEGMEAKLKKMGFHVVTNRETVSKINTASAVINALVILVGVIILLISSASIVNILTMSVYEEATDIAILRSVGARKSHVRGIYFLKAAFIGLMSSVDGLLVGFVSIQIANSLAQKYLQNLPYRPDTFFLPSVSLAAACFLVGLVFSLAAGTIPANIAASLNPSKVLREG